MYPYDQKEIDIKALVLAALFVVLMILLTPIWMILGAIYVPYKIGRDCYKDWSN